MAVAGPAATINNNNNNNNQVKLKDKALLPYPSTEYFAHT